MRSAIFNRSTPRSQEAPKAQAEQILQATQEGSRL